MTRAASAALGEVADFRSGGTPDKSRPEFYTGNIPWITGADIAGDRIVGIRSFITQRAIESSAASVVGTGSVLLVTRTGVGKVAITSQALAFSQDITAVLPDTASLHPGYLARFLRSLTQDLERRARGATIKGVTRQDVASLRIPLPPLDEQQRIALVLDTANGFRDKGRSAIEATRTVVSNQFLESFGNPITNPRGWPVSELQNLGQLQRGVSRHRPRNSPDLLGGPYPLVQTGDVARANGRIRQWSATYSELGLMQSKLWPAGTLCITIAANIADGAILDFDACFPDSVVGFVSDEATTEYVRVWLAFLQGTIEASAPTAVQKNINLRILRELPIPVPPRSIREAFYDFVALTDRLRQRQMAQLAELDALFASLQHRAFAGEL